VIIITRMIQAVKRKVCEMHQNSID